MAFFGIGVEAHSSASDLATLLATQNVSVFFFFCFLPPRVDRLGESQLLEQRAPVGPEDLLVLVVVQRPRVRRVRLLLHVVRDVVRERPRQKRKKYKSHKVGYRILWRGVSQSGGWYGVIKRVTTWEDTY